MRPQTKQRKLDGLITEAETRPGKKLAYFICFSIVGMNGLLLHANLSGKIWMKNDRENNRAVRIAGTGSHK